MNEPRKTAPDSTAARVALWRALHVQADPPVPSDSRRFRTCRLTGGGRDTAVALRRHPQPSGMSQPLAMRLAQCSPIIIAGAFVFPPVTLGMIEASATLSPSTPSTQL